MIAISLLMVSTHDPEFRLQGRYESEARFSIVETRAIELVAAALKMLRDPHRTTGFIDGGHGIHFSFELIVHNDLLTVQLTAKSIQSALRKLQHIEELVREELSVIPEES